jgi:putative phosphotransacetylase
MPFLKKKRQLPSRDFVAVQKVEVIGKDDKSCVCTILGPFRKETQVEFSFTEARAIGLIPPLGDSGVLEGTSPITIKGPKGVIHLDRGLFVPRRHVHMSRPHAAIIGVGDSEDVDLRIEGERPTTFHGVKVRLAPPDYTGDVSAVHLDYDEFNAAGIFALNEGYVSKGE